MTKELIEQYPDICAELKQLKRDAKTPVSDVVRGSSSEYPYTAHPVTVQGLPVNRHQNRIERLERQKEEIEEFVFNLPNSKERRIVTMRAMQGLSWKTVAAQMGHKHSESGVKRIYYDIFKK